MRKKRKGMVLEKLVVGAFQVNCYILASKEGGDGLIIDPGGDAEFIIDVIRKKRLNILYIIATHAHIDHIYA
ncbi:MBL fold metallo-hydrolase, partial [Candidatus Aerophobetes bacterium]|nr:MBL fold metallo-hydrolase [Candidatus Aerophobetes bacterium]